MKQLFAKLWPLMPADKDEKVIMYELIVFKKNTVMKPHFDDFSAVPQKFYMCYLDTDPGNKHTVM